MSNVSIGITAMELFAYNPFRIMGIPVNMPNEDIEKNYKKLLALSDSGEIADYKTPFDFDSLPPFSRSAQTVKTAYAKLASNGYRCFAYSDSQFLVSLNIDDIALNLRDITCYDCFLRCYMWLIINDREMQEHDLWIQLADHIDKMIMSSPEEWSRVFDHRYPLEMTKDNSAVYKAFYSTFCEIILLPLKEMVRGSMKCRTATEILQCAKIDVNEKFEYIDIPQANLPKPGHPAPKLKLAVKDGEEYFDISTGTMKSYSTDSEAVESNQFAESAGAPLEAEDLIAEEPEEEIAEEAYEQEAEVQTEAEAYEEPSEEVYEEPAAESEPVYEQPQSEPEVKTEAPEQPAAPQPAPEKAAEPSAPVRRPAPRRSVAAKTEERKPPKPTQPVAPKPEPLKLNKDKDSAASAAPTPRRTRRGTVGAHAGEAQTAQPASNAVDFSAGNPFFNINNKSVPQDKPQAAVPKGGKSFTKVVQEAEKEAESANIGEEAEDENAYTAALIQMLKTNQLRGETMKSVDTKHMVDMGSKEMTVPAKKSASMDAINLDKMDEKLLEPSADLTPKKLTREQKYRNIKIDDMLGTNMPKNYGTSAIEEFKKNKEKEKANRRTILALTGVLGIILLIAALMFYYGIL
ncbi:MAG: hypothetical protein ACI4JW_11970 [Oscillospiraceae bacterium]